MGRMAEIEFSGKVVFYKITNEPAIRRFIESFPDHHWFSKNNTVSFSAAGEGNDYSGTELMSLIDTEENIIDSAEIAVFSEDNEARFIWNHGYGFEEVL